MANENVDIVISTIDKASEGISRITGSLGGMSDGAKHAAIAVGKAALAAGAAVTVFAAASVVKYSEVGDAVEKMSKRTGLAAETVSALKVAADAGGTSIESVAGSIKIMQRNMGGVTEEGAPFQKVIEGLGLSFDSIRKSSPEQQFEAMAKAIGGISDPAERTRMAMDVFGRAGADLIPMFEEGEFSMDAWKTKAKELGVSFDDLAAEKAAKLNDALGFLKASFLGIALDIGGKLAPIVTELADRIVPGVTSAMSFLWDMVEDNLKPAWERLMVVIAENRPMLEAIAQFMGGALVVAIIAVFKALGLVIDGLAAMITWVGKAVEAWTNFSENVIGLWNDIKTSSKAIWDSIVDTILSAIGRVTEPIRKFIDLVQGVGSSVGQSFKNLPANLGFGGNKADGGPVAAGRSYLVGESGPERFVPFARGTIVPNGGGGGNITIHINNPMVLSDADIVEKVGDPIIRALKQHLAV